MPLEKIYIQLQAIEDKPWKDKEADEKKRIENEDQVNKSEENETLNMVQSLGEYLYRQNEVFQSARRPDPIKADEVLIKSPRTVILGAPGSGKSTLIDRLVGNTARNLSGPVPIHITLREYAVSLAQSKSTSLKEFALKHFEEIDVELGLAIKEQIKQKNIVWLLDGLDETRDLARHISREIGFLPGQLVLTSRPIGYVRDGLEDLPHFEILPLVPSDIKQFLQDWFEVLAQERNYDDKWVETRIQWLNGQIQTKRHLQTLIYNPLLLTFLVVLAGEDPQKDLPIKRFELYREYIERLLEQREIERISSISENLNATLKLGGREDNRSRKAILDTFYYLGWSMQLAYYGGKDRPRPTHDSLQHSLSKYLQSTWGNDTIEMVSAAQSFWEETGFFDFWKLEREEYIAFRHLTFQEYAAAWVLNKSWNESPKRSWLFIQPRLYDPAWHEVILLLAEMMPLRQINALFQRLLNQSGLYEPKLFRNLRLAADILAERDDISPKYQNLLLDRLEKHFHEHDYWLTIPIIESLGKIPYGEKNLKISPKIKVLIFGSLIRILNYVNNSELRKYLVSVPIEELLSELEKERELTKNIHPLIREALVSADTDIHLAAVRTLSTRIDNAVILSLLLTTIGSNADSIKLMARSLQRTESQTIPSILTLVQSDDRQQCLSAIYLLRELGDPALNPILMGLSRHRDIYVKKEAIAVLGFLYERGVVEKTGLVDLINNTESDDPEIQSALICSVGKIRDTKVLSTLIRFLVEDNLNSNAASQAIAEMGKLALPTLIDLARDAQLSKPLIDYLSIHKKVSATIQRIKDPECIPLLINLLQDKWFKLSAISALGQTGDLSVAQHIAQCISDEDPFLRQAAVKALGNLGASKYISHIIFLLQDENLEVKKAAITTIGQIGSNDAVFALRDLLAGAEWEIRRLTIEALSKIRTKDAFIVLLGAFLDEDVQIREKAAEEFQGINDPIIVNNILNGLESESKIEQMAALSAIKGTNDERAVGKILNILTKEKDISVVRMAIETLATVIHATSKLSELKIFAIYFDRLQWTKSLEAVVNRIDVIKARQNIAVDPALPQNHVHAKRKRIISTAIRILVFAVLGLVSEIIINLLAGRIAENLPSAGSVTMILVLLGIILSVYYQWIEQTR
jgi:HEAT repeat protein